MGNKQPSESSMGDSLRCISCNTLLPPCTSFSDLYRKTIAGEHLYVFNGGEYFKYYGTSRYICSDCFNRKIRDRQQREQERQRQQQQKQRSEKLSQRLQQSQQRAEQQQEQQQLSRKSVQFEQKQSVLKQQLDEFSPDEPDEFSNDLLEVLSSQSDIPIPSLNLSHLTDDQLGQIMSVLDSLLFDKWINTRPPLKTLQHAQVFLTQLCILSLETSEAVSLQSFSNNVQSLVETISQSADNIFENFLLTQALYLSLVHYDDSGNDAVQIARRWAEGDLSAETLFVLNFLCTLTESLQKVVGMASVFVLNMEVECLRLLFSTLTYLNGEETHSEVTEMHLRLMETNGWNSTEVLTLLKALSERYTEDASIAKILTLIQVYDVSPVWTNHCERSLIEAIDFSGPENFHKIFLQALENQDSDLTESLAELKMRWNLDESVVKRIFNITANCLQHSLNDPEGAHILKRDYKSENMDDDLIQEILTQLCKAVFHSKHWWPSQSQMMCWCAVVLTEKSQPPKLVGFKEDPCVTAMVAAMQICMGNKLDIVLSSGALSEQETKEWTVFYKHLGISINTNRRKTNESQIDVYEADIVYGAIEDFITDYFQYSFKVMEGGHPQFIRGFIIENGCLSAGQNLNISRLKDNEALGFVAEELQSLMSKIASEEMEVRQSFVREIFNVLHADLKDNVDMKVMSLSQKLTGEKLPSRDVYVLTFLETLTKSVARATAETKKNKDSHAVKWCFEHLLACAMQFQASKTAKDLLHMVSNLVAQSLWSPKEALKLLGTLIAHHQDESFISIMKILQLMTTYQISSDWKDENNQSLFQLIDSSGTQDLILHLLNSCKAEKEKSLDILFDEIRAMKDLDKETVHKSYTIIKHVQDLIKTGEIKDHADAERARSLSHSMKTEDLQEVLAVLCNAVHHHIFGSRWWPRGSQMASWCFLALNDNGKLLQMGTGEGKSVVVAMFAALRALRGEKVDVMSSSSVLCQRDAEECADFFSYFGLTVDTNTNKTKDTDRKICYQKDIVYGTVETYAADHLRQIFEMKDVRPDRGYDCIIIDEVDLLLLDQGIQVTYLSSPMVSMQHLNIILTMIWGHACQYGLLSTGYQTFVRCPPASFFKAIFDSMDTEGTEIDDPMDILQIAEECNIVHKGFTEEMYKSDKDAILTKLKSVSEDAQLNFFNEIEEYVPYGFTIYTLGDNGSLSLRKQGLNKQVIENLKFLVLDDGMCCPLYDSEETLIDPISELISDQLHYTPSENNKRKINIPGFLKGLVEQKLPAWVRNAFMAMRLKKGQEYVVDEGHIYPVDFKSTGIVELNKKWGEGLQQFVELKHQIKISTMSAVTNYVSNVSFFEKYNGKLYGMTGTLGSKSDMLFLNNQYPNISACEMPSFNRKKLFEVKGILKTSTEEWKSEVKRVLLDQISTNSHRNGRAALVICETINKVSDLYEELKDSIPGEVILYARSDTNSLGALRRKLNPGDVVLATNLAGRGTNIKVTKEVNENGGLFVILTFLSDNARVERQAFGRTARKGKPGSAQVIISSEHLQECYRTVSSLEEAKTMRDSLAVEKIQDMQNDIDEMKLREDLFSEYCKTLQEIYRNTDKDEQKAVVPIMNEFWGIWLQTKSEEIDQLKRKELHKSLRADLAFAKKLSESQNSPSSSIYHYIKFGNVAMKDKKWDVSARLFQKAIKQDASWAAIAFYNHAYCTIKQQSGDYLTKAKDDLKKAQDSLKYFSEECMAGLNFIKMSSPRSAKGTTSSLEKQFSTKCNMLSFLDKNMSEAIKKLDAIKKKGRDALAKKAPVFTLVSDSEEELQMETFNLYDRGLHYIFSVEEEPRFPWEALAVFSLGVAQIVGGALLTAFTFGTMAQVGMGLIVEGISDCITGIESMITGEFSWKSWAIEKSISIGVSLIGFGIGKLVSKGFKAAKMLAKGFSKSLKTMPKFFASQAKEGFSVALKTNMKNAVKLTAKKIVEETGAYAIGKSEDKIIAKILEEIEKAVKIGIRNDVKSNMGKDPLHALTDSIILSHIENKLEFSDLLRDDIIKPKLLAVFTGLSTTALAPFSADLSWQNQLNSSIITVIDSVKEDASGKMKAFLTTIQVTYTGILAADAVSAVLTLSDKFFTGLRKGLEDFKKKRAAPQKVKASDLSDSENKMLNNFREEIINTISTLLAKALVELFHQKFSSHLVSKVQSKVNDVIGGYVSSGLNTEHTEKKLTDAQESTYNAHMPGDKQAGRSGEKSKSHAEKVKNSEMTGSIVDIKILSETTGTKVVILTENKDGKLTKMQEMNPSTNDASETVTLVYRPKTDEHPDGHYDVLVNNKTVSVEKGDVYNAMAHGMNPDASKEDIASAADNLRAKEAEALEEKPTHFESFIQRTEWIEELIAVSVVIADGTSAAKKKKLKFKKVVKEESEKVKDQSNAQDKKETGQIINGDKQPSKHIILAAAHFTTESKLSKAMFEVAANSSDHSKCQLPVVYAPHERNNKFPTAESPELKRLLVQIISKDDVESTFKLTIIGATPTFMLERKHFLYEDMSLTRLDTFEHSFPEQAKELVNTWFKLLESQTDLMKLETKQSLENWINTKGYLDPNDSYRKQVTSSM